MLQFLQKPYPNQVTIRRTLIVSVSFGLFVFAFLRLFEPFGIARVGSPSLVCGFFGAWCAVAILLLKGVLSRLPFVGLQEMHWTVGKEIMWSLLHILVIGTGNTVFMVSMGYANWSLHHYALLVGYALAVGIFPVTISVLITEIRLSRKYSQQSAELNALLHPETQQRQVIDLPSENKNEQLRLHPEHIVFMEASENYVTVVYLKDTSVQRAVLRSSLKNQEEALRAVPEFFRPHKSYLVNCHHIQRISGNAQGYRLHLTSVEEPIPVSRRQNDELRKRIRIA